MDILFYKSTKIGKLTAIGAVSLLQTPVLIGSYVIQHYFMYILLLKYMCHEHGCNTAVDG